MPMLTEESETKIETKITRYVEDKKKPFTAHRYSTDSRTPFATRTKASERDVYNAWKAAGE
jgi:hypothetical protein